MFSYEFCMISKNTNFTEHHWATTSNIRVTLVFWFVFSRIRTEYGEILRISTYSVWMMENMDLNNSESGVFFTQCDYFSCCMEMIWNVHRIADNLNQYFVQKNIKYVLTVSKETEKKTN